MQSGRGHRGQIERQQKIKKDDLTDLQYFPKPVNWEFNQKLRMRTNPAGFNDLEEYLGSNDIPVNLDDSSLANLKILEMGTNQSIQSLDLRKCTGLERVDLMLCSKSTR